VLETVGNRILIARPADDLPDPDALLALAFGVADRVPNAVKVLHPALPAGELTPRCPIGADGRARQIAAPETRRARSILGPTFPADGRETDGRVVGVG